MEEQKAGKTNKPEPRRPEKGQMTDDPTKEDSPPISSEQSQEDPGVARARRRLDRATAHMLARLNDPEAVKRGEKHFEEGLDIVVPLEYRDEESIGKTE